MNLLTVFVRGLAFWLKGNPPFESEKEHCFFMLAVNSEGYFLMVNATSMVERTQAVVRARFSEFVEDTSSTLVVLEKGDFPLLSKRSAINCNELHAVKNSLNVSEDDKNTICVELTQRG